MTQSNANVVLMAAPLIASAALLMRLNIRKADVAQGGWRSQFGRGVAGLLVFALLFPSFCGHKCWNGQPYPQMLAGFVAALPVFLFVRRGRRRILAATVTILLAHLPAIHYNQLVHSGQFIGTTELRHITGVGIDEVPVRAVPVWHTPLTHLYSLETKPRRAEPPNEATEDASLSADPQR